MNCGRCGGRVFVDRVFSENRNYEVACVLCGGRRFINKDSVFGRWLHKKESAFQNAVGRAD